jgi:8-oxo-dGTP pyrophosphatase MutT (NUDIX family)
MTDRIDVTVAAVIESAERFLIVEEQAAGRIVFNQPAGHLEPGESLLDAVVRETLEESGYLFEPDALVGVYLWRSNQTGTTVLRVGFCGTASPPPARPQLDSGIVATHWLTRNQLLSRRSQLRSPMVMRCVDDYLAGARYPLDLLSRLESRIDDDAATA